MKKNKCQQKGCWIAMELIPEEIYDGCIMAGVVPTDNTRLTEMITQISNEAQKIKEMKEKTNRARETINGVINGTM